MLLLGAVMTTWLSLAAEPTMIMEPAMPPYAAPMMPGLEGNPCYPLQFFHTPINLPSGGLTGFLEPAFLPTPAAPIGGTHRVADIEEGPMPWAVRQLPSVTLV